MKTKQELKEMVCAAIDARRDEIIAFADAVAAEPELGFKETKTAAKFTALLEGLGRIHSFPIPNPQSPIPI